MPLPDAVREQGELADAALEALSNALEDTGAEPTPEPVPSDVAPEEGAEPVAESYPGPEPTLEPQPEVDYEQRYKTLEGKYKAEVPRLQQELSYLRGQLDSALVSRQEFVPEPELESSGAKSALTEEEMEMLGEEQLDMHSRIARGEAETVVGSLRDEVTALKQQLMKSRAEEAQSDFWDRVENVFPGAAEINESDPLWPDFLGQVDPVSGRAYRELGSAAIASGDVGRLVDLFRLYKGGAPTPTSAPETPVAKPSQVRSPNPQTTGQEKPLLKASQMQKFYDDWGRGVYKGKEQKAAQLDAMFEDAVAEGRIVAG